MFLNSKINGIPRYAMEVVKHMDPLAEGMDIEICYPTDLSEDKTPHFKNIKPVPFGKNGKGWDILCGEKYARRKNALYVNLASRGGLYKNSIVCLHDIRPLTWDLQHGKKTKHFLLDKLNFWLVAHNSKKNRYDFRILQTGNCGVLSFECVGYCRFPGGSRAFEYDCLL